MFAKIYKLSEIYLKSIICKNIPFFLYSKLISNQLGYISLLYKNKDQLLLSFKDIWNYYLKTYWLNFPVIEGDLLDSSPHNQHIVHAKTLQHLYWLNTLHKYPCIWHLHIYLRWSVSFVLFALRFVLQFKVELFAFNINFSKLIIWILAVLLCPFSHWMGLSEYKVLVYTFLTLLGIF